MDVLRHSFLPALSLVILGGAVNFQTMKLMVQNVNAENFVQYAKLGGVTEDRIVSKYVIRNAILPQITGLALSLGQIFSGALITEIVFTYPGLGTLLYHAGLCPWARCSSRANTCQIGRWCWPL
jgi:peptide/nickel transport system permease protein